MLLTLRLFLLGIHFLVAGAVNLVIVLLRPFNPDNTRLCGRVYSLPALRFLGLQTELKVDKLKELNSPCVFVVNHQSNFDLFVLGRLVLPMVTVRRGTTLPKTNRSKLDWWLTTKTQGLFSFFNSSTCSSACRPRKRSAGSE